MGQVFPKTMQRPSVGFVVLRSKVILLLSLIWGFAMKVVQVFHRTMQKLRAGIVLLQIRGMPERNIT